MASHSTVGPATEPEAQNIVWTAKLCSKIMMRYLAVVFAGQFNPKRFAAAIIRLNNPGCTGLLFSSGEMVCTGCKSPTDALLGLHTFKNMVEDALGIELWLHNLTLWNIVCSCDLGYALDLSRLHRDTQLLSDFIPELFPGIHFEFADLGTMLTAFGSGSIIVTGGRNMAVMQRTFYRAFKLFSRYKLGQQRGHQETLALHKQLMAMANMQSSQSIFQAPNTNTIVVRRPSGPLAPTSVMSQPALFAKSPFNFAALLPPPPVPPSSNSIVVPAKRRNKRSRKDYEKDTDVFAL